MRDDISRAGPSSHVPRNESSDTGSDNSDTQNITQASNPGEPIAEPLNYDSEDSHESKGKRKREESPEELNKRPKKDKDEDDEGKGSGLGGLNFVSNDNSNNNNNNSQSIHEKLIDSLKCSLFQIADVMTSIIDNFFL